MKRTIWKFTFEIDDEIEIEMPHGSRVIHIGVQTLRDPERTEQPCMWAIVNPDEPRESWAKYKFLVFGTGHPLPDQKPFEPVGHLHHLGTFQMLGGSLVFHVFSSPSSSKAKMD